MPGRVLVDADLTLTLTPARGQGTPVEAHLTGSGTQLRLEVSRPAALADLRGRRAVAALADQLAHDGLRVRVVVDGRELMVLGAPRSSWWQARITGSRHIKIHRFGAFGALALRRPAGGSSPLLPVRDLTPPATPIPIAPTFLRRPRGPVTTTHDPSGGGDPRLVAWPGDPERRQVLHLRRGVTTLGGDPGDDIVLPGMPAHAVEVRRNADDEYVLVNQARRKDCRLNGEVVLERILRTGARLEVGTSTLVYAREEYADHGRPYGGRIGGELGHQRPQPPRRPRHADTA